MKSVGTLKGGKVKASDVLLGVSSVTGALSTTPLAPFTAPIALLSGIAGGIARIFGGNLSGPEQKKLEALINKNHRKKLARKRKS